MSGFLFLGIIFGRRGQTKLLLFFRMVINSKIPFNGSGTDLCVQGTNKSEKG
jgi:hypothetical protein